MDRIEVGGWIDGWRIFSSLSWTLLLNPPEVYWHYSHAQALFLGISAPWESLIFNPKPKRKRTLLGFTFILTPGDNFDFCCVPIQTSLHGQWRNHHTHSCQGKFAEPTECMESKRYFQQLRWMQPSSLGGPFSSVFGVLFLLEPLPSAFRSSFSLTCYFGFVFFVAVVAGGPRGASGLPAGPKCTHWAQGGSARHPPQEWRARTAMAHVQSKNCTDGLCMQIRIWLIKHGDTGGVS